MEAGGCQNHPISTRLAATTRKEPHNLCLQLLHNGKIRAGLNLKTDPTYQRLLEKNWILADITTPTSELSGIVRTGYPQIPAQNETIYSNID